MKGIVSGLKFNATVDAVKKHNWTELVKHNDFTGCNKPYDGYLYAPDYQQLRDYIESSAATDLYTATQLEQLMLTPTMREIRRTYSANDTNSTYIDLFTPHDFIALMIGSEQPYRNYALDVKFTWTSEYSSARQVTPMIYQNVGFSGQPVSLFDISYYLSNEGFFLDPYVSLFMVEEIANVYYNDKVNPHARFNKSSLSYCFSVTNPSEMQILYNDVRKFAEEGTALLWLCCVSQGQGSFDDIKQNMKLAEVLSHQTDINEIFDYFRYGVNEIKDVSAFLKAGLSFEQAKPYLEADITDIDIICQAIETKVDASILSSLMRANL